MQYTRNEADFRRGTFRVRGDVIDIFPAEHAENAVRISLFDDAIESLQLFDPLTGHIRQRIGRFTVFPSSHYVTGRQKVLDAIEKIKVELVEQKDRFVAQMKLVEAQRIEQRTRFDLEMMTEIGFCKGIENYSRHLSGRAGGRAAADADRLSAVAIADVRRREPRDDPAGRRDVRGDRARKENLVNYGFRLPSALDNRPLRFDEFERLLPQTMFISATPAEYERDACGAGRRAAGAADRARRSGARGAARADAGRRSALGDQRCASVARSACSSPRSPSGWPRTSPTI